LVADKVDWYLDELVAEMERLTGKQASVPTLWRSLKFCGIRRKKVQNMIVFFYTFYSTDFFFFLQLQKKARERKKEQRNAFITRISRYTADQLVFLDKVAKDERTLTRQYGYSMINSRARKSIVFVRGKRYTILPALSLDGIIAFEIIEGSYTKDKFYDFILDHVVTIID
jgi:hypothetical protein